MKKNIPLLFLLSASLIGLVGCGETPSPDPIIDDRLFEVNIPTFQGGKITSNKQKYKANETVQLTVTPNEGHFLTYNSLTFDGNKIDSSLSFTMPENNVTIGANFKRDEVPENQIHGARFTGEHLLWNMAMVHTDPIQLNDVQGLLVEVRFNKIIPNFFMRLACATVDGTVYDAFGKAFGSNYWYSCDMDHPNATDQYNWSTAPWGGWSPSWNKTYDVTPPTYYIEVPLYFFFARYNLNKTMIIEEGTELKENQVLSQLGLHITADSEVDFTIGNLYIRQNGIVKNIATPYTYSKEEKVGYNKVEIYKIDSKGTYPSTANISIFENVKQRKYKTLLMGDSIMTRWWTNDQIRRVCDEIDTELVRDTIGGTTIAEYSPNRDDSIMEHMNENLYEKYIKENDFDLVIIQRGTNDLWQYINGSIQMGTSESTSEETNTIMGSLRKILEYFKVKCPKAKIVVSSPLYRYDSVSDTVVKDYRSKLEGLLNNIGGINYFDLYSKSGIDASNYQQYLNSTTHPHHNASYADNLHPNDEGAVKLGDAWTTYLKSIL